jgi:hypothetical protein
MLIGLVPTFFGPVLIFMLTREDRPASAAGD